VSLPATHRRDPSARAAREHPTAASAGPAEPMPASASASLTAGPEAPGAAALREGADVDAPLPSPAELRRRAPLGPAADTAAAARAALRDVLHGRDARLVAVVGPCSIHDPEAALAYAARLARTARELSDALVVVMRTYFEKPRTRVGWKGFLSDPHLDGRGDPVAGLEGARRLLARIGALGLGCGAEVLDPLAVRYLEDGLAWACVGARTVQSQIHRELASGLPMPVGFKNATDGNVRAAHDAMAAASLSHTHLCLDASGRPAVRRSGGNRDTHVVLRGGGGVPNHDAESVAWAAARARQLGTARPVLVDCSHDNSHKNHRLQGAVCREVLEQVRGGHDAVAGFMLESSLEAGRQDWEPGAALAPGVSITDACIGWEETEALLREAAEAVRARA